MSAASDQKNRHVATALSLTLALMLVVAVSLAAMTRRINREPLPRRLAEIQQPLAARHQGEDPCVRWALPAPLTPAEVRRFEEALRDIGLTPDLHVVLPLLSLIRQRNRAHATDHHALDTEAEAIEESLARLPWYDQWRLRFGRHDPEELLPWLAPLRQPARQERDQRRAARLLERLDPDRRADLDALVDAWRTPLASPEAQASLVQAIAERVTHERLRALGRGLQRYRQHYGYYPAGLAAVIELMDRTRTMPTSVEQGVELDRSLRDGWLRPFEYYTVGNGGFRLTSEGPSDRTDEDDLLVTEADP